MQIEESKHQGVNSQVDVSMNSVVHFRNYHKDKLREAIS